MYRVGLHGDGRIFDCIFHNNRNVMSANMLFALAVLLLATTFSQEKSADQDYENERAEEYCAYENFHPSCSKNEVIFLKSAIYGRMKEGRCLELDKKKAADKQDPQYFGCSVDVLKFMDGKCSGKPECNIRVNDQELLRQESSCYKDLMKYLESVHECVPVVQQDRSCLVSVTEDPMHLSSSIQSSFGCGTKSQHWTLEASSGQQINLRLLDFSGGAGQSDGGQCRQQYGYIVDKQAKRNVSICGNGVREKDLYLSRSNEILIVMSTSEQQNFLVQIHATGCHDLKPPPDAWLKRTDNEAIVGCYTTRQTWHLHCKGRQWMGVMGNCTQQLIAESESEHVIETERKVDHVFILVVIGCVSTLICLTFVCICLTRIRRNYKSETTKTGCVKHPTSDYNSVRWKQGNPEYMMTASVNQSNGMNGNEMIGSNGNGMEFNTRGRCMTNQADQDDYPKYFILDSEAVSAETPNL